MVTSSSPSAPNNRGGHRADSDGSDDEGVVLRSRPERRRSPQSDGEASLGSDAMSESDSEANGSSDEVDVAALYPIEGKFSDEADRARIMAMTEVEREAILAERNHEIEMHLQNQHLRQMLQNRNREDGSAASTAGAAASKKRKRRGTQKSDEESEDDYSPGEYRRLRRGRSPRQGSRHDSPSRSRSRSRSRASFSAYHSDRGAYSSEGERDEGGHRKAAPAELRELERIRIGRSNFGQVCLNPRFEETVEGCFCRVVVGFDKDTSQNVYRMAQIVRFMEDKPYRIEEQNGKPFVTDQHVVLAHGDSTKSWPMTNCSNSPFTMAEYERWKKACYDDDVELPSSDFVEQKLAGLRRLVEHKWTQSEVAEKLKKRNKYKLADYPDPAESQPSSQSQAAQPVAASVDKISLLNKANRDANREMAIQAQIRNRRRLIEAQKASARETTTKLVFIDSETSKPTEGTAAREAKARVLLKRDKVGVPSVTRLKTDDEVIGEIELDIDIDI